MTVLRDTVEGVRLFSWETVLLENVNKMPTLMLLLMKLIPQSPQQKALLCFIASQLLKSRHQRMGLVQCSSK